MTVSTRDRILDVAMDLFGQHGYRGTSITAIERAAGLTAGAGGIYHHFPTKQALLEAGIARHLGRLDALRDIRAILTDLGDLRAELTVLARYAIAELDHETDLLRIVLTEARAHPELVQGAVDTLIAATYTSFAGWLQDRADLDPERAETLAAVGLGALFSARLLRLLLGRDPVSVDDQDFVEVWVQMMHSQIGSG
jgi:AcrR family transcriptional regulator